MIKTNELRIGNYLFMPFTSENVKVTGLALKEEKTQVIYIQSNFGTSQYFALPEQYSPIKLTEEWLLKAGFEKDDSGVDMFDQDYYEWYQKEFPIIGLICQSSDKSYIFDENTDTLRLKYVHELQNLYFALTGSELVFSSTEP